MGGLSKYWETRADKMRADACLCENYARTGVQFFEILHNLQRPYLDNVEDFCEFANMLNMSTYNQYVYSLKLCRKMTEEEAEVLAHTLRRELSKIYGISVDKFVKRWNIKVIGNNVFFASI